MSDTEEQRPVLHRDLPRESDSIPTAMGPSEELAQGERAMGRLVNRLPSVQENLDLLPYGVRYQVIEFAVGEMHARQSDIASFGSPICDGMGIVAGQGVCFEREGLAGAGEAIDELSRHPSYRRFLNREVIWDVNNRPVVNFSRLTTADIFDLETCERRSVAETVRSKVGQLEHQLHRYGVRSTRRNGYELGKIQAVKWLILFQILFNVPLVEGYSFRVDVDVHPCAWVGNTCQLIEQHYHHITTSVCFREGQCEMAEWVRRAPIIVRSTAASHISAIAKGAGVVSTWVAWLLSLCLFWVHFLVWIRDMGWAAVKTRAVDQIVGRAETLTSGALVSTSEIYQTAVVEVILLGLLLSALVCVVLLAARTGLYLCYKLQFLSPMLRQLLSRYSFWSYLQKNMAWCRDGIEPLVATVGRTHWFKGNGYPILEMSMSGSDLFNPKDSYSTFMIVAEMEEGCKTVIKHIGMGFRYGNYLVTANHVVNQITHLRAKPFLVPFMDSGKTFMPNTGERVPFDFGENIVEELTAQHLDIAIFEVSANFCATLGIKTSKSGHAAWNSPVTTYGFADNRLQAAAGVIIRDTDPEVARVSYTASTLRGWSGGPVMAGKKVVAVHQRTRKDRNEGLDIEAVKLLIHVYERTTDEASNDLYWDKVNKVVRDDYGNACDVEWLDMGGFTRDQRTGKRRYFSRNALPEYVPREEFEEMHPARQAEYIRQGGYVSRRDRRRYGIQENAESTYLVGYPDEPERFVAPLDGEKEPVCKPGLFAFPEGTPLRVRSTRASIGSTPLCKGKIDPVLKLLDIPLATSLGFDEAQYEFPVMLTPKEGRDAVEVSMDKHLKLFVEAQKNSTPPDREDRRVARMIMLDLLAPNRYKMIKDPFSKDNLTEIINSTRIDGRKSPGYPFIEQGFRSNAEVIAEGGLIEKVRESLDFAHETNVFIKSGPTKCSKLKDGMPRLVHSVSLLDQTKAHAIFGNANDQMVKVYKQSPIQGGFSPLKAGDGSLFYRRLNKRGKVVIEDDVKNWDYSLMDWMIEDVVSVLVDLAVRPKGMTPEEGDAWKVLARKIAMQQFTMPFRLPSGTVIERTKPGIMTSGTVLTFLVNSMSMVYLDTLAKLAMGLQIDSIKKDFILKVGGDDKIQSVPKDFDHSQYLRRLSAMGLTIHGEKVHDSMSGAEFFSWKFGINRFGEVSWVPTRFTKHVTSLMGTRYEDVSDALVSHMRNWAHDASRFEFFYQTYLRFHEVDPDRFPLNRLVERSTILDALMGNEAATVPPSGEASGSEHREVEVLNKVPLPDEVGKTGFNTLKADYTQKLSA